MLNSEHPRTQRGTCTIQSRIIIFTFADGHRGMRTLYAPKARQRLLLTTPIASREDKN
jgi:hypothetical protein